MARNNEKLNEWILSSQVMIENSLSDDEIKKCLSSFGYSESKLLEGKKLYEETLDLINKQKKEYGEQFEASEELQKAWDKANQTYIRSLKVSRVAFQNNIKAQSSMMLNGSRKPSISGWLEQATAFYSNLSNDEGMILEMSKFGYDKKKIDDEYTQVNDVIQKNLKQKKETGEAQEATELRDRKIDELDRWVQDYRAIVKIALEGNPQKLEKLGILARTK